MYYASILYFRNEISNFQFFVILNKTHNDNFIIKSQKSENNNFIIPLKSCRNRYFCIKEDDNLRKIQTTNKPS